MSISELVDRAIEAIGPLDAAAVAAAEARQGMLTKPPGSLGRLEALSIQLAGITGQPVPAITGKAVIVAAGDHGVASEGVSAYPAEVTLQMVFNFVAGGAAINALARHAGADIMVIDAGVAVDLEPQPGLTIAKVGYGAGNIAPRAGDEPRGRHSLPGGGHQRRQRTGGRGRERHRRRRHGHRQHHAVGGDHGGHHRRGRCPGDWPRDRGG